jgi:hypothetical protein
MTLLFQRTSMFDDGLRSESSSYQPPSARIVLEPPEAGDRNFPPDRGVIYGLPHSGTYNENYQKIACPIIA